MTDSCGEPSFFVQLPRSFPSALFVFGFPAATNWIMGRASFSISPDGHNKSTNWLGRLDV
jgi:hypothetical protein